LVRAIFAAQSVAFFNEMSYVCDNFVCVHGNIYSIYSVVYYFNRSINKSQRNSAFYAV
jgi:hypothetical protein